MLKKRIITACLLIPLTLIVIFYFPPPLFLLLTAIIVLAAAWEWTAFMGLTQYKFKFLYLLIMLVFLGWALYVPMMLLLYGAFAWWLIASALVLFYPRLTSRKKNYRYVFMHGVMGICVLLPCWAAINFIRNQDNNGLALLLFLFVLVWGADSTAYFAGKKWGKTKLAARVSPGKSIEGVVGALLFALLFSLVVYYACDVPVGLWVWGVALSLVTVVFSVVGDLFESVMKREAGLKDSGKLFPGHGGLLDRIDSLTAAAPVFALGSLLIGSL